MSDVRSRRQARRLADARGLSGLANDTKWTKFFNEIVGLAILLQIKLLYEDAQPNVREYGFPPRTTSIANMGQICSCSLSG